MSEDPRICEQKEFEKERERLIAIAGRAQEEAERATRAKDAFIASISHELRTPLNSMLGWIHLLRSGKLDSAASARALDTIERNIRAQTRLIDDLLDIARITAGKFRISVRPVQLGAIVEEAVNALHPAAEAKGIIIRFQRPLDLHSVAGDPARLQQVVENLLSNAVKFTPEGGSVDVELQHAGCHCVIRVRDSGKGISPEFLPHLFERFRQADAEGSRKEGGLGLGLAIVRHLVEVHGGSVQAESAGLGHGAAFTVLLPIIDRPVAAEVSQDSGQTGSVGQGESTAALQGLPILVVDDDPGTCELLTLILERSGAEVKSSTTAGGALEIFQRWRPAVLISDVAMPDLSGHELLERIRRLEPDDGPHAIAVALTGYARAEDRRRMLAAGYQEHVAKPVDLDKLVRLIVHLVTKEVKTRCSSGLV